VLGLGVTIPMFWLYTQGVACQAGDPSGVICISANPEDRLFLGDKPSPDVVVVGIDDATLRPDTGLGHFPFTRERYATLLDNLAAAGASVVAFDVQFSEPSTEGGDRRLHDSIARAGIPVVLAYATPDLAPGWSHQYRMVGPDQLPLRAFRCLDSSPNEFAPCQKTIAELGSTAVITGRDGVVRDMPLFTEPKCHVDGNCSIESVNPIGFVAYRASYLGKEAQGGPQLQYSEQGATFGPAWKSPLPVDPTGRALINFATGQGAQVRSFQAAGQYLSFADVYNGKLDRQKVSGKIVMVGAYNATGLHDEQLVPTGGGRAMPGVEIHANFLSMLLSGTFLQPEPSSAVALTLILLGALMGLVLARLSLVWGLGATIAVLILYTVGAVLALQSLSWVPDLLHVWLAVALTYTGLTAYRFLYEDREKQKVTEIFGQYLKPEIVNSMAAARTLEDIPVGGVRRDLTLLFTDIRGFTAMSETMPAEAVTAVLDEYLAEMTQIVFRWDGTLDKYVGDELMAIWNAPHDQAQHALLAVRCASEMLTHQPHLDAGLAARGLPAIKYGIGINTGPAVWGNMGSTYRRQWTAIGDTINTAARFCSVAAPLELLIGEPTYALVRDYVAVELAPGIQLKGKSAEAFRIYRVLAIREQPGAPWVPLPAAAAFTARTAQTILGAGATVSPTGRTEPPGG
jgi:adenylate cyclase